MEKIKRFFKEEEGLEMSEYALMGAIICLGVIVAISAGESAARQHPIPVEASTPIRRMAAP